MQLERKRFISGDEIAIFEVGYTSLQPGCNYVLNPTTQELEQIWGYEKGHDEERVETTRDTWYPVDGLTIFAKRINDEIPAAA